MGRNIFQQAPYETYTYYFGGQPQSCPSCKAESAHVLLRLRTHSSALLPFLSTDTAYYYICKNCGHAQKLDSEGEVALILDQMKRNVPKVFKESGTREMNSVTLEDVVANHFHQF